MHPITEKHPKQLGSNPYSLLIVPAAPVHVQGVQKTHLKIGLINSHSVCNRWDEMVDGGGDLVFVALAFMDAWLISGISNQKMFVI